MSEPTTLNTSRISRFLKTVEWLGNALPHPVSLFALFAVGVVLLSGVLGYFDVSVADPRPEGAKGRADNGLIEVVSLMNAEGLRMIVLNLVKNFVEFAPLGTVLVALLGVGVAERSAPCRVSRRSTSPSVQQHQRRATPPAPYPEVQIRRNSSPG